MLRSRASVSLSIKKDSTLDSSTLSFLKNSSWIGDRDSRTSANVGGCVDGNDVTEREGMTRRKSRPQLSMITEIDRRYNHNVQWCVGADRPLVLVWAGAALTAWFLASARRQRLARGTSGIAGQK